MPPGNPMRTMRLVVPDILLKGEIKDEIILVRQCGCGYFVAGKEMQDKRQDCPI
jgi:hypothetical protein